MPRRGLFYLIDNIGMLEHAADFPRLAVTPHSRGRDDDLRQQMREAGLAKANWIVRAYGQRVEEPFGGEVDRQ